MGKRLYRDEANKVIGGVCAGLAEYFGTDIFVIRLIFMLMLIFKGGGFLIYIVLWIALPPKPYRFNEPGSMDYTVPNSPPQWANPQFVSPPKGRSSGTIIAGIVLVLLGAYVILDDFNIIPNIDFDHFWPLILIAIGVVLVFSGGKKQPWEKNDWHNQDNSSNNNPPVI